MTSPRIDEALQDMRLAPLLEGHDIFEYAMTYLDQDPQTRKEACACQQFHAAYSLYLAVMEEALGKVKPL